MKIGFRCYDNQGKTVDRYTVVFTGHYRHLTGRRQWYIGSSVNPFHPQGVGQHGESDRDIDRPSYGHLGKRVSFDTLPENVQRFAQQTAKDLES